MKWSKLISIFLLTLTARQMIAADPTILFAGINVNTYTGDRNLIFSIVATDPDGVHDLVGGVLLDPGGLSYGALTKVAEEGTYSFQLDWQTINKMSPLDFYAPGGVRNFIVRIYDQAGNFVEKTIPVSVACPNSQWSAKNGFCADLKNDPQNCGQFGKTINEVFHKASAMHTYQFPRACIGGQAVAQLGWSYPANKEQDCSKLCNTASLTCGATVPENHPMYSSSACTKGECIGSSRADYYTHTLKSCTESNKGSLFYCFCRG